MIGYLLDTNVVFELLRGCRLRPSPSRRAQERLAPHGHEVATVARPSMPVLPFKVAAAKWLAAERARLDKAGLPRTALDGQRVISGVSAH